MSVRTEAWIREQADESMARACVVLGEYLNGRRPFPVRLVAPDCSYSSQFRPEVEHGRPAVRRYLQRWLERPFPKAFAELGNEPLDGAPCLMIHARMSGYGSQGLGELRNYFSLRLDERGRIESVFAISIVPPPQTCTGSGIFPGLSPARLDEERGREGPRLQRSQELGLELFVLDGLAHQSPALLEVVEGVARALALPAPSVRRFQIGDLAARRFGVVSHPSVVLTLDGRSVRLFEGWASAQALEASLAGLLEPLADGALDRAEPTQQAHAGEPSEEAEDEPTEASVRAREQTEDEARDERVRRGYQNCLMAEIFFETELGLAGLKSEAEPPVEAEPDAEPEPPPAGTSRMLGLLARFEGSTLPIHPEGSPPESTEDAQPGSDAGPDQPDPESPTDPSTD